MKGKGKRVVFVVLVVVVAMVTFVVGVVMVLIVTIVAIVVMGHFIIYKISEVATSPSRLIRGQSTVVRMKGKRKKEKVEAQPKSLRGTNGGSKIRQWAVVME